MKPNKRNAKCCGYCKFKLQCDEAVSTEVCDDFVKGPFVKHVPGLPAMHPRDWEILGA
jgi:hypothetical protein